MSNQDDLKKRRDFFQPRVSSNVISGTAKVISGAAGLLGLVIFLVILGITIYCKTSGQWRTGNAVLIGIWAMVPPAWFWFEYFLVVPSMKEDELPSVERFKHGQDVSAKLWAAGVLLLAAIYHGVVSE